MRATSRVQMFYLLYSRIKDVAHLLSENQEAAVKLIGDFRPEYFQDNLSEVPLSG